MSVARLALVAGLFVLAGCSSTTTPSSLNSPSGWVATPSSGPSGNTPTSSERPHVERASSASRGYSEPRSAARCRHC
jgi:hypothetical protein